MYLRQIDRETGKGVEDKEKGWRGEWERERCIFVKGHVFISTIQCICIYKNGKKKVF